jgi:hypothetical protein
LSRARAIFVLLAACGARTDLGGQDRLAALKDAGDAGDAMPDAGAGPPPSPCKVTSPTVLFSGGKEIQFIALDDVDVYYSDFGSGTVGATPKGGGSPRVIAPGRGNPSGLAVRDGTIYWTEFTTNVVTSGASSGGGSFTTIAKNQDGAYDVAVSDTGIYWTTFRACTVARKQGSASAQLDKAHQPFTQIITTGDLAFWISFQRKSIERFDSTTQTRTTLLGGGPPMTIATDGKSVFYGQEEPTEAVVGSVPIDGGPPTILYTRPCEAGDGGAVGTCVARVATDGAFVYFTSGDGFVRKVPVGGGAEVVIAAQQAHPFAVAVDDSCVYWSNLGDGTIWAAPKL